MTTTRATKIPITIPNVPGLEESVAQCYSEFRIPSERAQQAIAMKAEWRRRLGPDGRTNIGGIVAESREHNARAIEERMHHYLANVAAKYSAWQLSKIYVVRDTGDAWGLCLPYWGGNERHNHFPLGTAISLLTAREPRLAAHIPGLRRVLKPRVSRRQIVTSLSVNPFDLLTCGVGFASCYGPGKQYDAGGYQLWFDPFSFIIMSYAVDGTRLWRAIGVCDDEFRRFAIRRFYGHEGSTYVNQAVRVLELVLGEALTVTDNTSSTTIRTPAPGYQDPVALRLDRPDPQMSLVGCQKLRPLSLSLQRAQCPIPTCSLFLSSGLWEHPYHPPVNDPQDDGE